MKVLFIGQDRIWMIPGVRSKLKEQNIEVFTDSMFQDHQEPLVGTRDLSQLLIHRLHEEEFGLIVLELDDRRLWQYIPPELRPIVVLFQATLPNITAQHTLNRQGYPIVLGRRALVMHLERYGGTVPQF